MVIHKNNAKIINSNQICLHDDILLNLYFDRINKKMIIKMKKHSDFNKLYNIIFVDVIGFEMSSCDFWGISECVLDFEYVEPFEERTLVFKLTEKCRENFKSTDINLYDDYIEVLFTFGSGDYLRISSKEINIDGED